MPNRISFTTFLENCGGVVEGYGLREGQALPETYDGLVAFVGDRLGLPEANVSVVGLSHWLMSNLENPDSCNPDTDTRHVETVLLIGELPDPDKYVAELPDALGSLHLPPSDVIRQMINNS